MSNYSNYSNQSPIPNYKIWKLGNWELFRSIKIIRLIRIFFFLFFVFNFISPAKAEAAAYLSLSPTAQSVEVGESLDVDVVLNTGNSNTDAADVIINYDSAKLTLTAATLNDLYDNRLVSNTSVAGKVTLRATASAGNYFNGTGTFATLSFTGKAIGTASVSFDFSANSTTDSNVAYSGSDILGSVANGSYQVVAAGTLTSAPTRTATRTATQPVTGGLAPTVTLGIFGTFFLVLGALAILF